MSSSPVRSLVVSLLGLICASPALATQILYGSNGNSGANAGAIVTINQTTGVGTLVGNPSPPGGISGIDFGTGGLLFGTTVTSSGASNLLTIDPVTGALINNIGSIGISIGDLAFDRTSGVLYGIRSNADSQGLGGNLYTINTATGAATLVGDTGAGAGGGIAFTNDGRLYQTSYNNGVDFFALNELDPLNAGRISTTALGGYYDGLAIRVDGTIFAVPGGSANGIYTITTTGLETLVGNTGTGGASDLAFTPVPEPGALLLLSGGLVALAFVRRRLRVH